MLNKKFTNAFKALLLLGVWSTSAQAQQYPIDTLQFQGTKAKVVNMVILGDGYTKEQMANFQEDAKRFTDYFFKTEPFRQYANFFNVFAINTPSQESGAVHSCTADDCPADDHGHAQLPARFNEFPKRIAVPKANPNTIFGSSFDNYGLHRLVIPQKVDVIEKVLADHVPNYTEVVILVNSPYYGGSGGKYATTTVNASSNDIAVHEIGHSFGILADEYWAGNQYAIEGPNRTQHADPNAVPWKHWLGSNGIGIYSYGSKSSPAQWFRPHEFCKMQYLVAPFCSVCQEVFVEAIHKKTDPIVSSRPATDQMLDADQAHLFSLNLLKPSPNTLQVKWFLNEDLIALNKDSIYLNKGMFAQGTNSLRVEVRDTTDLVRTPEKKAFLYQTKWNINNQEEAPLVAPQFTWGDSLETCFDGYQALTVKQPAAGVQYNWYTSATGGLPFAQGANVVTEPMQATTTYYVEASYKAKQSKRSALVVKVLPAIEAPQKYKLTKEKGGKTLRITLLEKADKRYSFLWKKEDGTILYEWDEFSGEYMRTSTFNKEMRMPMPTAPTKLYVQKVDNETTCVSESLTIEIK